jgi:hypothetical protein
LPVSVVLAVFMALSSALGGDVVTWDNPAVTQVWIPVEMLDHQPCTLNLDVRGSGEYSVWVECNEEKGAS